MQPDDFIDIILPVCTSEFPEPAESNIEPISPAFIEIPEDAFNLISADAPFAIRFTSEDDDPEHPELINT
jgi:hypothetical protein